MLFGNIEQDGSAGVGAPAPPPAAVAMPMSSWRSPAVGASLSGAAPAALWDRRLGSSVPGGLQGAAGGGRERPVGQGGEHGADPEAWVLHPGRHIAQVPHAQPAGTLSHPHFD